MAQEIIHSMKHSKAKKGSLLFKMDLEKAYDTVRWVFLIDTLARFNFPFNTIRLIHNCIANTSMSLLWNRERTDQFIPTRDLRQGDPLSMFLFVIYLERLSMQISQDVHNGD